MIKKHDVRIKPLAGHEEFDVECVSCGWKPKWPATSEVFAQAMRTRHIEIAVANA
jgi:hypothetical protein